MPIMLDWKNCDGDLTRFIANQKNTNPIISVATLRSINKRAEKRVDEFAMSAAFLSEL
jgi:hypothetical protein